MNELATFPASIRKSIEDAHALAVQSRPKEAEMLLKHVAAELARVQPEFCALLLASQAGFTQISVTVTESTTTYEKATNSFFGITRERFVPVCNTKVNTRSFRLLKE